jgi:hypothetical protein
MRIRFLLAISIIYSLGVGLGCSAGGGSGNGSRNSSDDEPGSGDDGSGATQPDLSSGNGGGLVVDVQDPPVGKDPNDPRDVPVRTKMCDANGENCTCLRLALLGTLDSAANQKDTQPFVDWLNDKSGGTATVTMVSTKPTLDEAWLASYDILLVANVNGWTFSAAEKTAVETWVRESGGGIVALTGFVSTDAEPAATSQLVEFAGMGFEAPKTAENGQAAPVFYQGGEDDLKSCLSWTQSSEAIITTPVQFTPQTDSLAKLTLSLDYVGAFIGWAVKAPAGSTVVAKDPISGSNMAVALEVDGTGRIFAFGDEWVIFRNQWEPAGSPHNMQMDQYNKCWSPAAGGEPGFFHSVQTLYQTKQFWYDAINWVAPPNECNFVVDDPDVVVK